MTDFRVGDRVRIKGTVTDIDAAAPELLIFIGKTRRWFYSEDVELVERPAPALKVGDVVNGLPDLPHGSIVTDEFGIAWQKLGTRWHSASPQYTGHRYHAGYRDGVQFTVLNIGGAI